MKFPTILYKLKEGVIWVGCDKLSIFNKEKILFLLKKLNSSSKIMRWDFKNSTLFQISILVHLQIFLPIKATKETTINSLGLLTIVLFCSGWGKRSQNKPIYQLCGKDGHIQPKCHYWFNISFTRPQK